MRLERPKDAGPAPVKPENLAKRDLRTGSKLAFGAGAASTAANYDDGVAFPVLPNASKPTRAPDPYFKVDHHQNQIKNIDFEESLDDAPKAKSKKPKKQSAPVEIVKKDPKPSQPQETNYFVKEVVQTGEKVE